MLHVALDELPAGAQQQVLAQQARLGVDQRHDVLQLVAETERAPRLVEAAAPPDAARERLVRQPPVRQHVEGRVRRFDLDGAERALPVLPDRLERRSHRRRAPERVHVRACLVGPAAHAEPEDHLALLPGLQFDAHLHRGTRVEGGACLARQACAHHGGRPLQRPVAAEELGAVSGHAATRVVDVEERHAFRELGVEGIAGEHRTARRVDLGGDVHRRAGTQVAEHPLRVPGHAQPSRHRRVVAQLDQRELDRCVQRDEHGHFRADAGGVVFEHAVAEPVAAHVRVRAGYGRRRRRPEPAGVLVPQVERLAARVHHWIVVPRREPELVCILGPGVAGAALGDDRAELRIGQHVDPGRGRGAARAQRHDVFAAVAREPAELVGQHEVRPRLGRRGRARRRRGARHRRLQQRNAEVLGPPPLGLVGEAAAAVGDDHPCDRREQHAVLLRNVVGGPHEDAAGPVDDAAFAAAGDQPHDLVVQLLAVSRLVLGPDHEVHDQPFQAPVRTRAEQLADEVDVRQVADLQQHDRQVARDRITPQPGLAAAVLQDHRRIGAHGGVGEHDRTRQALVVLGFRFRDAELLQRHLVVRPRQVEDAVGDAPVLVALGQVLDALARVGRARDEVDGRGVVGLEHDALPDRDDRVEHRAFAAGERPRRHERLRARERAVAADETRTIGFEREVGRLRPGHRHQVQEPARSLVAAACTACAQHGALRPHDLGLHEQLAEGRVQGVRHGRCERDFDVTRDLDRAPLARVVDQPDATQLDVLLGRDRDLRARLDQLPVDAVAAMELGAPLREDGLVLLRLAQRGLRGIRPERAGRHVAHVAEAAPVVARGVLLPTRQRDVLPAAVAAARGGEEQVIARVRQQLNLRHRRVGARNDADRRRSRG